MDTAIRFEGVSKQFVARHAGPRSFQELAVGLPRQQERAQVAFWALREIDFEIAPGETVGFIGPNGSGKSTLLKLIARILAPTCGWIEVNGRIGPLLELGAGFHPDLTGRENVFLNGSLLGLRQVEVHKQFDAIVAFAELERFIDMPVRHYSAGMSLRLGFSIAAHVSPDILLVDEVLAVGDEAFQRKCLERMETFRQAGCTIVFVSHDLRTVERLCARAFWLAEGRIRHTGPAHEVVARYLAAVEEGR
ncbi:MAG: ABC transporter ATP-binding protein [Anaerolineae bacterium]|nr:ABC transporter ATP-binding protein [Anaerolineae bacterium]